MRCWAEINLDIIKENYKIYKELVGGDVMATVKADAYGHGAVRVAGALAECGVSRFAVATLDEAIELREGKIGGEILVLGYTPPTLHRLAAEYDITAAIVSEEQAEELISLGARGKYHIAIDTGMARVGITPFDGAIEKIRTYCHSLNITGAFTHLYHAYSDEESEEQLRLFDALSPDLLSLGVRELHALNSLGGVLYRRDYLSFARCGITLYGLLADDRAPLPVGIRTPLSWHSRIVRTGVIRAGCGVGYLHTYKATRDTPFATVSAGYADGVRRGLSNKGYLFVNGVRCKIIGNICMDQLMIDISECKSAKYGDTVTLLSCEHTADDMARELNTIGYEIVTGIGKRVPRIYV